MRMNSTSLKNVKTEWVLPLFFGILIALVFCAHLSTRGALWLSAGKDIAGRHGVAPEMPDETPAQLGAARFFAAPGQEHRDVIAELFQSAEGRGWVVNFFAELCPSAEIAETILHNADAFNVPPALAFALCWEESRLNPLAVNAKNRDESIDRGLFQLNSRSFPLLDQQAFFNPAVNARYGMAHLRHCLNTGGSEIAALAMYNAGTGRVNSSGTPRVTLDYVNRILENRRKIEAGFFSHLHQEKGILLAENFAAQEPAAIDSLFEELSGKVAEAQPSRPRFALLAPLAGRR